MANMRNNSNSRSFLKWTKNYSSWAYIDSIIFSLQNLIDNLTIIPIFDAGLANNFAGSDIAITKHRTSLHYRDEQFVYFMREHRTEADPLIIQIAKEVGGFVISGDKYEEYASETAEINELIFVPVKKGTAEQFEFFKSSEYYEIRGKNRNFEALTKIHKVGMIQNFIDKNSDLTANDTLIRDQVFGPEGIEFQFWEDRFRTTRQGEKEVLRSKPFANLTLRIPVVTEKRVPKILVKLKRKSTEQSKEQVVVFCDSLNQFNLDVDTVVQVVGKLGRSGEQIFLEWFRGDKAVLITGFYTKKVLDKNFLKIPGVLSKGSDGYQLKMAEDAQFEQLSFIDAVTHRLSHIVARSEDEAPRRWFLPSLNWGRQTNISRPKQPNAIPPPPTYRIRTSEERLLELESQSIRPERLTPQVPKESDALLPQDRTLTAASYEATVSSGNDLLPPGLEMRDDSKSGVLSTGQRKFESSRPPVFRTAVRKRRVQDAPTGRGTRGRIWFWVFLVAVAFALAVGYFVVDLGSETTNKEAPTVAFKCWGTTEKICVKT